MVNWVGLCIAVLLLFFILCSVGIRVSCHVRSAAVFVQVREDFDRSNLARQFPFLVGRNLSFWNTIPYAKTNVDGFTPLDLKAVRRALAWNSQVPYCPESVTIVNSTNVEVMAKRRSCLHPGGRYYIVYLQKQGSEWAINDVSLFKEEKLKPGLFDLINGR